MAAPHSTFSQALSTSIYNYVTRGKFADNIFEGQKLLQTALQMDGKRRISGGESIVVQLEYAENATASWIGPYGTYNTNPQDIVTSAQFNWRQLTGTVILTDLEMAQNSGATRLSSLIEVKIKNLQKSLRKQMNAAMYSDGTDALKPVGLEAIIGTTGTLGGISRSAQTWWQANVESTAEVLSVPRMETMYNDCSAGGLDYPQVLVTTQALYEKYGQLAQNFQEITHSGANSVADLSFEHYRFKGTPIFWDAQCTAAAMYYVNWEFLKVYCHEEWEFKPVPAQRVANQPLEVHAVIWFGALAPSNPRMLGKLTGKTAS